VCACVCVCECIKINLFGKLILLDEKKLWKKLFCQCLENKYLFFFTQMVAKIHAARMHLKDIICMT